jgi:hypothetical protein
VADSVAAIIAAHPPRIRSGQLARAVASVWAQTQPVTELHVAIDHEREGAPATRQRALMAATTDWVAFLDSDDWWYPQHVMTLLAAAQKTGADYLYSYFQVHDDHGTEQPSWDPLGHFGKPFNPADPHQTTITTLVRRDLAQAVGFAQPGEGGTIGGQRAGEDWEFTLGCLDKGAHIAHVPQRTWAWCHHDTNTSGLPSW